MSNKLITVGIIVKNEEEHIKETINSVLNNNFPKDKYEILIVDGNSTDKTQNIIKNLMRFNKNIRLIIEPWEKGTHGKARNLLADNAKGKYVAFTDGDCIVKKNWLTVLFNFIEKERKINNKVIAVGGIRKPIKTDNWKENLINNIMSTFFGSGGSKGFMSTNKKYVDSVPNYNSIYLTKIIQKERYSDNIGVGEDYEFNMRLNKEGYKIAFSKEAIIYHHQEKSILSFLRQIYNYGKAQTVVYRSIKRVRFFAIISTIFVIGLIVGFFVSFINSIFFTVYLIGIGIYLFIDLFYTLSTLLRTKKLYSLFSFIVYPLMHVCYGMGVIKEVFGK